MATSLLLFIVRYLFKGSSAFYRFILGAGGIPAGIRPVVIHFNKQPVILPPIAAGEHQGVSTRNFFPLQVHLYLSVCIAFGQWHFLALVLFYILERPAVPYHHRARPVLAFRNLTFKVSIVQRMIFGGDGQPLIGRIG